MALSIGTLIGRRIEYSKEGSRKGWKGTINNVRRDSRVPGGYEILIEYDNGVTQVYSIEALEYFGYPYRFPHAAGYLKFTSPLKPKTVETRNFIIMNERTGKIDASTNGVSDAESLASSMARDTKDTYRIYKSFATAKVEEPPVVLTRTELNF